MQSLLIFLLIFSFRVGANAQSAPPSPAELAALRRLEPQRDAEALRILNESRERFGLDSRYTFQFVSSATDSLGRYHGRFREYFNNVRVRGGNAIVHLDSKGKQERPTLKLFNNISVPATPPVSQADAIKAAAAQFDPAGRYTDVESEAELVIEPDLVQVDRGEPTPGRAADTRRRYEKVARGYRLVWQIILSSESAPQSERVYSVDAISGRVLRSAETAKADEPANAKGHGYFAGRIDFRNLKTGGSEPFVAIDPDRGSESGNTFLNANHGCKESYAKYAPYRSSNNEEWGDGVRDDGTASTNTRRGTTAYVDAQRAVAAGWDLLSFLDRNGYDNKGTRVYTRLHFNKDCKPYGDAQFRSGGLKKNRGMFLGDGRNSTSLSTIGHELGHGFFYSIFGWDGFGNHYEWEGINEGQADILGALTEFLAYKMPGEKGTFTMLENDWRWRSRMVKPLEYFYDGDKPEEPGFAYWSPLFGTDAYSEPGIGSKEEHRIGCLFGRMFVFLADGASSDPAKGTYSKYLPQGMSGIGVQRAAEIWATAMIGYVPEQADYLDVRDAFQAAVDSPFTQPHIKTAIALAFAGIGAGGTGNDEKAPEFLDFDIVHMDAAAGFLEVRATVLDLQPARVEFYLDNQLVLTDYVQPFGGGISVVDLAPGQHKLEARAYDTSGNKGSQLQTFQLTRPRSLVKNGSFETADTWSSDNAWFVKDPDAAFSGSAFASISPGRQIWQDVTIPTDAVNVQLHYRIRAENFLDDGRREVNFVARLRNTDGSQLAVLSVHKEGENTFDTDLTRTWKQVSLPIKQRGPVRLVFESHGELVNPRFKLDNVSITYELPTSMKVSAKVRPAEQTVEFASVLTGHDPAAIQRVEYYIDDAHQKGKPFAVSASTGPEYRAILSTDKLTLKSHLVTAVLRRKDSTEADKSGVHFNISSVSEKLKNGDFENGLQFWPVTGGATTAQKGMDMPTPCFMSERCGMLGAIVGFPYSTMQQGFALTFEQAASATLSYRIRIQTTEQGPAALDSFYTYILDPVSKKRHYLGPVFTNMSASNGSPESFSGWFPVSAALPASLNNGGSFQLVLESKQNNQNPTRFYIDNVSVVVKSLDKTK